MKAYKGFNLDMTCRGFQFEEGKTYKEESAVLCESGFHACENPLDVWNYYPPDCSVYHEVDLDDITSERGDDSKRCGRTIKIGARMTICDIVSACVKRIGACTVTAGNRSHAVTSGDSSHAVTSGNRSHAVTSGNRSHAVTSGYSSHAVTSGYSSHAVTSGLDSIAVAIGVNSYVKTERGNWIVCAEYDDFFHLICVKSAFVDGKTIKANTWYKLKDREFVEAGTDE